MTDLRDFIDRLEEGDDLLHIEEKLSPRYEISAALRAFDGGKALVFEDVEGYDAWVVGGVCGTRGRILDALNIEAGDLYGHTLDAVRNPTPCEVGDGPVKEVVGEPGLSEFPVLTHFEGDPGPYITSGILYARSPDGSVESARVDTPKYHGTGIEEYLVKDAVRWKFPAFDGVPYDLTFPSILSGK